MLTSGSVTIRQPEKSDESAFVAAMLDSRALHNPWVKAPTTPVLFDHYLNKYQADNNISYLVIYDHLIAGVININEIVRGCFQSAYLGYYAVAQFSGQGIMRAGLLAVIDAAFDHHGLHRLEANIQPSNIASIKLVKSCGFEREGYSKAYLKINNEWQDHERWAIRKEMMD